MTWTKLSDDFTDRPEFLEVPRSQRLLLVEMYVWANRLERDGRVPFPALRRLSDIDEPEAAAKVLEEAGLIRIEGNACILDWSQQDSAEEVQERRAYRAEVQKKYRKRKEAHARGNHSLCDPRFCRQAESVTGNASSNESTHETPSRPVPSRPKAAGKGQRAAAGSAGAAPAPRSGPIQHAYLDDGSGLSCDVCNLPKTNSAHAGMGRWVERSYPFNCGYCGTTEKSCETTIEAGKEPCCVNCDHHTLIIAPDEEAS